MRNGRSLRSTSRLGPFAVKMLVLASVETRVHFDQIYAAGSTVLVSCSFDLCLFTHMDCNFCRINSGVEITVFPLTVIQTDKKE